MAFLSIKRLRGKPELAPIYLLLALIRFLQFLCLDVCQFLVRVARVDKESEDPEGNFVLYLEIFSSAFSQI